MHKLIKLTKFDDGFIIKLCLTCVNTISYGSRLFQHTQKKWRERKFKHKRIMAWKKKKKWKLEINFV